jgi:drug/metabolite transporter (DMT)-like permease
VAHLGEALAVASLLFFSANVLLVGAAGRRVPQDLGFLLALASNVVFAGLVLAGQLLLLGGPFEPDWSALGWFALGGLLTSWLGRWFYFRSVRTIGPTRASALQITNPVFAALAALLLLGEALPPQAAVSGAVVLAGLYLTSRPTRRTGDLAPPGRSLSVRDVGLALVGAAAYGVGNVVRGAGVREWAEPVVGSLVGAAAGLVAYALLATDLRKLGAAVRGADRGGVRLWVLSGVLTITAQTCLIAASQYVPVAVAVVISAAVPIVVLPVSVLFLRRTEAVGVTTAAGAVLVLAGVAGLVLG